VRIGDRPIGPDAEPFVIAEMSGNHGGSLDRALALVDAAAAAGAHALKLQTYSADTMTLPLSDGEFYIEDPANAWAGRSLHALYQEAHTPRDWHSTLFQRCRARRLIPLSSPFDETAVDFLESLDCPAYKIASFELVDLPLIRHAARTGKPLLMSVGMGSPAEIDEAVRTARAAGCQDIALLQCTSAYPAEPGEANLRAIPHLQALFDCPVGLSDHTQGIGVAIAAVAVGAPLIEKHLTLARAEGGVDAAFSLEPAELQALVQESRRAWQALGSGRIGPSPGEAPSLRHRRSLYVAEDLKAGDVLTPENLRRVRPGNGLAPRYYELVLGRRVRRDVARGTPLSLDLLLD
jgi:N-acetylneuraminate synthase